MGTLGAEPQAFDVFAHVDESGFLNFMDNGGERGLFGCGSDDHFGVVRTTIEVGSTYSDDYEIREEMTLNWADGESSSKNISLRIVKDGRVDSDVWEDFQIYIHNPAGASVDENRDRAVIRIRDEDGPGQVNMALNASHAAEIGGIDSLHPDPVAERGLCCGGNCAEAEEKPEEAKWCAEIAVRRSAARGNGSKSGLLCCACPKKGALAKCILICAFEYASDTLFVHYVESRCCMCGC